MTIATATTPQVRISCPSWCIVTEAEHRVGLDHWEGRCHHRSHETAFGWSIISTTTSDGQPWPEPGEDAVQIFDGLDGIELECAQARAEAIMKLIYRARRA